MGVLFDIIAHGVDDPVVPLQLTVHFNGFPHEQLLRLHTGPGDGDGSH